MSPVARLLYNRNRWDPQSRSSCQAHFMLARPFSFILQMLARPSRFNQLSLLNRHQIISCTLYRPGCTVYNVHSVAGQNHSFKWFNRPEHSEHSIPFMSRTIHSYSGRYYAFLYTARSFIHIQTMGIHSFVFKHARPFIHSCTSHLFLHGSGVRTTINYFTNQENSFLYRARPLIPIWSRPGPLINTETIGSSIPLYGPR